MNKSLFFILSVICLIFNSCSEEQEMENYLEDDTSNENRISEFLNATSPLIDCNYSLKSIPPNEAIDISCLIDLEGQTVTLNQNVQLNYSGGDIINGTLKFNNGKIDGRFLNKSITIEGKAELIDPSLTFVPSRWDIEQGHTSYRKALENRLNLESLMQTVKLLSGHTLIIDEFDAYFEVTEITHPTNPNFYPSVEAINIPSNFSLIMSDKTHLRTFPNSSKKSSLIAVRDATNVLVKGGTLHGDRDEHNYVGGSSHEWGHLIDLHAAKNTTINNVKMINATGDGLVIHSLNHSFQSNYNPSHDIIVTNCIFDSSRRNLLAITGGYNITVEHCEFYRAGVDTEKSKGTNPKFAIDIEAYRRRENGKLVLYEKVENVVIRNNIERDGARGGFLIAIGDNITIEDNDVADGIGYKFTNNSIIRNNKMVHIGRGGTAMGLGMIDSRSISNNKVIGNYIEGFDVAMTVYGKDHLIENNTIKNCGTGISGKSFSDTKILNNKIVSDNPSSRGIFVHYTSINRVLFKNNYIDVPNNPIKFDLVNLDKNQDLFCAHLVNNVLNSNREAVLTNTNGISLMKNKINTGLQLWDSKNSIIEDNEVKSNSTDGIYLLRKNESIALTDNKIDVPSNKQCIRIQSSTTSTDVKNINNNCLR